MMKSVELWSMRRPRRGIEKDEGQCGGPKQYVFSLFARICAHIFVSFLSGFEDKLISVPTSSTPLMPQGHQDILAALHTMSAHGFSIRSVFTSAGASTHEVVGKVRSTDRT